LAEIYSSFLAAGWVTMALYAVEGYKVPGNVGNPYKEDGSIADNLSAYYGSDVRQIMDAGRAHDRHGTPAPP
jgi:hypothetical protein